MKSVEAVTNEGYGEIMTIRHMDMPEHPVHSFSVGIVTHHFDRMTEKFEVDPFDTEAIRKGINEIASIFIKYIQD